jgi:hypothetical protein
MQSRSPLGRNFIAPQSYPDQASCAQSTPSISQAKDGETKQTRAFVHWDAEYQKV